MSSEEERARASSITMIKCEEESSQNGDNDDISDSDDINDDERLTAEAEALIEALSNVSRKTNIVRNSDPSPPSHRLMVKKSTKHIGGKKRGSQDPTRMGINNDTTESEDNDDDNDTAANENNHNDDENNDGGGNGLENLVASSIVTSLKRGGKRISPPSSSTAAAVLQSNQPARNRGKLGFMSRQKLLPNKKLNQSTNRKSSFIQHSKRKRPSASPAPLPSSSTSPLPPSLSNANPDTSTILDNDHDKSSNINNDYPTIPSYPHRRPNSMLPLNKPRKIVHNLASFPFWMASEIINISNDNSQYFLANWDSLKLGKETGSVALNDYFNSSVSAAGVSTNNGEHTEKNGHGQEEGRKKKKHQVQLTPTEILYSLDILRPQTVIEPPPNSMLHAMNNEDYSNEDNDIDEDIDEAEAEVEEEKSNEKIKKVQLPWQSLIGVYKSMCQQESYEYGKTHLQRSQTHYMESTDVIEKLKSLENMAYELEARENRMKRKEYKLGILNAATTSEKKARIE